MKKRSDFSRLMGYAGNYRYFTYASWVLSAVSALVALVPFVYIWKILRDVLNAAPDYAQAVNIPHYGWMAVLFAVLAYLIYIAALMCSHLSAFRVATNLRLEVSEHLATLPLGFTETFGSGKLRKIIHESTGAAETFLAHQLPDKYNAMATPIGLLVLLLVFDWRLGLLSLVPVALGFVIMSAMTGRRMADKMRQYGNALESMSNEAVEYVRGIPVVKTFGQSVFSFKKFKATIDEYEKWVIAYTKELRMPMMLYTAAINGVFAFLIVGGLLFTRNGVTSEFLLNLLFYIIITPVISLTLTRIMYMSENELVVADALARVDSVLDAEPVPENDHPRHPKDASVSLKDVHFSYDSKTDVIKGVSLKIQPGQTVAFVGPSGGGKSTLAKVIAGIYQPTSGQILLDGVDITHMSITDRANLGLSYAFQQPVRFKGLRVKDLLSLAAGKNTSVNEACSYLSEVGLCARDYVDRELNDSLSGGELKRIEIAMVLARGTKLSIFDEPEAGIDLWSFQNLIRVFEKMYEQTRGSILIISHQERILNIADKIVVIKNGQVEKEGARADILPALLGSADASSPACSVLADKVEGVRK